MDLVTPTVHLALTYVDVVNRAKVPLSVVALDSYGEHPGKIEATQRSWLQEMNAISLGGRVEPAETMSRYLGRLGWIEGSQDSLHLTDIGRAVMAHADRPVSDSDNQAVSVVIDPDDPLAYLRIFGLINEHDGGLLVDPYMRLEGLIDLTEISTVTRVLTSASPKEANIFNRTLKATKSEIEVRLIDRTQLHDRFFIADEAVYVLGSSLNSITRRPGVVTPVGDPVAVGAIKDVYETMWDAAQVIADEDTEDVNVG